MTLMIDRLIAGVSATREFASAGSTRRRFAEEARLILNLLNEAWSENWGYVPLTETEIAYAGKKLKPIIYNDLVRIAEYRRRAGRLHAHHPRHQ